LGALALKSGRASTSSKETSLTGMVLANLGILTENAKRCFALTPLGDALKTGAPGSARATILTVASDWWVRGFGHLLYSVETGKSGFEKSLGMPLFDWLEKHPAEASMFGEFMVGVHEAEPLQLLPHTTSRA
jgi:hypothetical protein